LTAEWQDLHVLIWKPFAGNRKPANRQEEPHLNVNILKGAGHARDRIGADTFTAYSLYKNAIFRKSSGGLNFKESRPFLQVSATAPRIDFRTPLHSTRDLTSKS